MTVYKLETMGGEENEDCVCTYRVINYLTFSSFCLLEKKFFHPQNSFSLFYKVKSKNLDLNS